MNVYTFSVPAPFFLSRAHLDAFFLFRMEYLIYSHLTLIPNYLHFFFLLAPFVYAYFFTHRLHVLLWLCWHFCVKTKLKIFFLLPLFGSFLGKFFMQIFLLFLLLENMLIYFDRQAHVECGSSMDYFCNFEFLSKLVLYAFCDRKFQKNSYFNEASFHLARATYLCLYCFLAHPFFFSSFHFHCK